MMATAVTGKRIPAVAGGSPIRQDYLVFGRPRLEESAIDEVVATLRSGWIGTGPKTARFESELAAYLGVHHVIAVSSCTAALHLALLAAGIGPGDDVLVPAMTFVATANAVLHAGANPVLCDVDPTSQVVTPEHLAAAMTPRTRAIIPVHFAGRAAPMTDILDFARRHECVVINDAAHAVETRHAHRNIAGQGGMSAYSFYPTKQITTGEGGAVATNDERLADRVRLLHHHGLTADAWKRYSDAGFKHYEAVEVGYKCNMTDIQASLGLHQLARIEESSVGRRRIWARYNEAFASLPVTVPAGWPDGDRHAMHLYTLLLDLDRLKVDRDAIAHALHLEGIGTGVHYRGVHLQPLFRDRYGYRPDMFPHATRISDRTISIPLSPSLSDRDVDDVIEAVQQVFAHFAR
jgi:dTDP-4-amino-4,6-dideoxygalactose transaminase